MKRKVGLTCTVTGDGPIHPRCPNDLRLNASQQRETQQ